MSAMRVRFVNEQLMALERTFVLPGGLPDRPLYRHSVFSPPRWDAYAAAGFSGLSDLLHDYDENDAARKEKIKRHINELTILTQRASAILKDSPVL
ncbi:putative N-acetylated-alpha-linked acidic dipeptidase [Hyalella azteca]|nr:putative N-acetylated-alpha-linked acidic dipeptidase [Hyalella azteca]